MNKLDFYTSLYGFLYNRKKINKRLLSLIRYVVRYFANRSLPSLFLKNKEYGQPTIMPDVVLSLTSFPARIEEVWKVVETLKRQSVLPEIIILWLSRDQFRSAETLPQSLRRMEDDIFQIRLVDGDIKSHKKYYYAMNEYPEKTIVTCDDDQFYDPNLIKRLLDNSRKYPGCIIANKTLKIQFDKEGNIIPYKLWKDKGNPNDSENLLQVGVGGVLYPPHSLNKLVLDKDLFLNLAPLADDIWLNSMARLNDTPIVQASPLLLTLPIVLDSPTLFDVNLGNNMNDEQINNIRTYLRNNNLKDVYSK